MVENNRGYFAPQNTAGPYAPKHKWPSGNSMTTINSDSCWLLTWAWPTMAWSTLANHTTKIDYQHFAKYWSTSFALTKSSISNLSMVVEGGKEIAPLAGMFCPSEGTETALELLNCTSHWKIDRARIKWYRNNFLVKTDFFWLLTVCGGACIYKHYILVAMVANI